MGFEDEFSPTNRRKSLRRQKIRLARSEASGQAQGNPTFPTIVLRVGYHPDHTIMVKLLHVYYAGSVQGVGFRFTVERTAASLGLTGWVKNLGDGRVEAVVEGEEAKIESFRKNILDIFDGYIHQTEAVPDEATGEFGSFEIRF